MKYAYRYFGLFLMCLTAITLNAMEASDDVPPPPPSPEKIVRYEKQKKRKSSDLKPIEEMEKRINDMQIEISKKIETAIREARMEGFEEAQRAEKEKYEQKKKLDRLEQNKKENEKLDKDIAGIDLVAKALRLELDTKSKLVSQKKKKKNWFRKNRDVEHI